MKAKRLPLFRSFSFAALHIAHVGKEPLQPINLTMPAFSISWNALRKVDSPAISQTPGFRSLMVMQSNLYSVYSSAIVS